MASKIYTRRSNKVNQNGIVYEVVRPQRKVLSRYKLKKQAGIIEQILYDPQLV